MNARFTTEKFVLLCLLQFEEIYFPILKFPRDISSITNELNEI